MAVLPRFTGTILQRPPSYSAVKRDGRPLYALARQGEMVQAEARETAIWELELMECTGDGYMLRVDCGSGTYIRTLCHDIGQALGAPAHMRFLLRTRHGCFALENAVTLEEVQDAAEKGMLGCLLLPPDTPLQGLPRLDAPDRYKVPVLNGAKLPIALMPGLKESESCRVYYRGTLTGVAHRAGELLRFDMGLMGEKEREELMK